jgi:hypothetical protein
MNDFVLKQNEHSLATSRAIRKDSTQSVLRLTFVE